MQVTFSRTGGFAPMAIGCRLDTANLPPEDADQLELLVRQSGIMTMKDARVPGARDVHLYSIEVVNEQTKHKVTFDQLSVPASVKPLFEYLSNRSQSLLPD